MFIVIKFHKIYLYSSQNILTDRPIYNMTPLHNKSENPKLVLDIK